MSEDSFDIGAGKLCLDYANTNNWHASEHPVENLHNYTDLANWGKVAGLISGERADQIASLETDHPETARHEYDFAIQLREAIYRIFSNRYKGKPIVKGDMEALNAVLKDAMAHRQLATLGDGFQWKWAGSIEGTNQILWPVVLSAAELLTSNIAERVRECEDDRGCGYLFIDTSKNHSRRWCSMESCGNRAKARRHYSRSKIDQG